jgi:hypothetical protein
MPPQAGRGPRPVASRHQARSPSSLCRRGWDYAPQFARFWVTGKGGHGVDGDLGIGQPGTGQRRTQLLTQKHEVGLPALRQRR